MEIRSRETRHVQLRSFFCNTIAARVMISMSPPKTLVLQRTKEREKVAFWLGTWFGCGLSPRSPGTVGSLGALPLYFLVVRFGPVGIGITALVITLLGIVVSTRLARASGCNDPQFVVIDEVAGMLFTLAFVPARWDGLFAALVLFRLFDILKPPPCRWIEKHLPPGPGIMLDDVFAAIWAIGMILIFNKIGWL